MLAERARVNQQAINVSLVSPLLLCITRIPQLSPIVNMLFKKVVADKQNRDIKRKWKSQARAVSINGKEHNI